MPTKPNKPQLIANSESVIVSAGVNTVKYKKPQLKTISIGATNSLAIMNLLSFPYSYQKIIFIDFACTIQANDGGPVVVG